MVSVLNYSFLKTRDVFRVASLENSVPNKSFILVIVGHFRKTGSVNKSAYFEQWNCRTNFGVHLQSYNT